MPLSAHAAPVQAPLPWKPEQAETGANDNAVETLRRVETYLNDIKTIQAEFTQIAPDGSLAYGKVYIKRPGKMRWQYAPPTPVLMVSNGDTLTYYDYDLDQINRVALDDTLAGLLAKENIDFEDDALRVLNFREGANSIRFTLLRTEQADQGTLTFELSDNPMKIETIIVTDAAGNMTSIKLQDARYDVALDDALFTFQNPRSVFEPRYQR